MSPGPSSRNLALLLTCQVVTTLGLMMLVPIMPLYLATLTPADAGNLIGAAGWSSLALAAPGLGALCCAPYAGKWCGRFGYRRMLLPSLALFVISMLLMALSSGIAGFMLGRLLQGISSIGVILTAFIGHVSSDASRGRSLGLQESAIACGALAGPVLGGVLLDYWSLRPLLTASALVTGVAGGILWSQLREPAQADASGSMHFSGLRDVLADRDLRHWMFAACLAQAAGFALINVFALYLAARFPHAGALASKTGLLHALGWLATMLAGPLWGHLGDRGEPRRYFILAAGACALSMGLLTIVEQLWLVALLRVIQGACYAALMQSMLLACSRQLPASAYASLTGVSRSFMVLGQMLGPLLIMLLLPVVAPIHLLWAVAALFLSAGLLALNGLGLPYAKLKKGF